LELGLDPLKEVVRVVAAGTAELTTLSPDISSWKPDRDGNEWWWRTHKLIFSFFQETNDDRNLYCKTHTHHYHSLQCLWNVYEHNDNVKFL